jgi:hypothetical protein
MTSRDFCYWLQGFFEVAESGRDTVEVNGVRTCKPVELNPAQVQSIRNHLAMVFKHEIDPSFGDKEKQDELNKIHNSDGASDIVYRC